jgi:hypothetical protein
MFGEGSVGKSIRGWVIGMPQVRSSPSNSNLMIERVT